VAGYSFTRMTRVPSLDRNIQVTTKRAKIPYNKPPLSISEQIAQLQKRGLVFIDLHKAADLLSHINYFRLEAYWYTFYDNTKSDHVFIHGTSFDFVWKHYCFDRRLRAHITHALERIEVSFRTQFAYHLSKACGPFPLNDSTLQFSQSEWHEKHLKLRDLCQASTEKFAAHFYSKYSDELLPIWAMVEILSFGEIGFYYKKLRSIPIKTQISSTFGLNPKELSSWLHHLTHIRNICAHHARLWNKRFTILPLPPQRVISPALNSRWIHPSSPMDNHYNNRRLHNTLLIIDYLLSKICPDNIWKKELIELLTRYPIDAERMGFPACWSNDTYWH